jgi:hypothetical protein
MLPTPKECLPPGYPSCSDNVKAEYEPIWDLAWQIHKTTHKWMGEEADDGPWVMYILQPVDTFTPPDRDNRYCDCYIKAWLRIHGLSLDWLTAELIVLQDTYERVI